MKQYVVGMLCLLIALFSVNVVLADDPAPLDNWCDIGGPWADGRCVNDWFWECGWLMVRYERGEFTREQIEASDCWTLLPPKPIAATEIIEISPGVCAMVYRTSTTTIDVTANWGSPISGQNIAGWLYPRAIGGTTYIGSLPLAPADTSSTYNNVFVGGSAPSGAPGNFRLQTAGFVNVFGPVPCPVTIIP